MSKSVIVSQHTPLFHLGFYAEDAKAFAQAHHELYGSGPFILMENVDTKYTFRGVETTTNLTIASGWWKDVGVEIIQQNSEGASYLNENGRFGFHHICFGVSDIQGAIKEFEEAGNTVQFYNFDRPDFPFCYIDARETSGYYIELNPQMDMMTSIARKWAADWDGESNLFRSIQDAMAEMKR